jgi:hypothetical protein
MKDGFCEDGTHASGGLAWPFGLFSGAGCMIGNEHEEQCENTNKIAAGNA